MKSVFELLKESAEVAMRLYPRGYDGNPAAGRYSKIAVWSDGQIQLEIAGSHAGFYADETELIAGLELYISSMKRSVEEKKLRKAAMKKGTT